MNWRMALFFLGIAIAVALGVAVGPLIRPFVPTVGWGALRTAWFVLRLGWALLVLGAFFFAVAFAWALIRHVLHTWGATPEERAAWDEQRRREGW